MKRDTLFLFGSGLAAAVLLFLSGAAYAQSDGSTAGAAEIRRVVDKGDADKATAPLRVVMPGPSGIPPEEDVEVPPPEPEPEDEPEPPVEEPEDPPTFFGEPVGGRFVWVLDYSLSMPWGKDVGSGPFEDWNGNVGGQPNRLQIVQAETIKVLRQLKEEHEFAIVFLGGCSWVKPINIAEPMVQATQPNIDAAIQRVISQPAWLGTPTYDALNKATHNYGAEIDNLFFLSDGAPTSDDVPGNPAPGLGSVQYAQKVILKVFPGWYAPLKAYGCKLTVIHIGNDLWAGQFMTEFANATGATFIKK